MKRLPIFLYVFIMSMLVVLTTGLFAAREKTEIIGKVSWFTEQNTFDEIVAIAKKEKPDVIVMDVRLPDMRGSEAARILREDKETSDIPIVFVTASVMAGEKEEISTITDSGFIGKPINTRTFAKELSQFIK